jgi:hypothetical protein
MTAQEFADTSTQAMRAQQRSSALKESQVTESMQAAVEARCRETMEGNEAWRSKDSSVSSSIKILTKVVNQSKMDTAEPTLHDDAQFSQISSVVGEADIDSLSHDNSRIERRDEKSLKRSINVDLGSRFTSNKPKRRKDPSSESVMIEPIQSSAKDDTEVLEVPRTKAPNVLDLLKTSSSVEPSPTSTVIASLPSTFNSYPTVPSSKILSSNHVLLRNSDATVSFVIQRPGQAQIGCVCCVADRFVHSPLFLD